MLLHLGAERIELGRSGAIVAGMTGTIGAEVTVLCGSHGAPQIEVGGAAGTVVGGFRDGLADQGDLHGPAVKLFFADGCAHVGDKGRGQLRAGGEAAWRVRGLLVGAAYSPVGEDLGPGVESGGQRELQEADIIAQVGVLGHGLLQPVDNVCGSRVSAAGVSEGC